ncbi:hypothetical protein JYB64_18205 [Algoriphagus aestuarii]|nr:hypothetical protein [Algoriphagus aestuarii]
MKRLLIISVFFIATGAFAQNKAEWNTPKYQVSFESDQGADAKMEIDQGYKFADLDYDGKEFHLFFDRDMENIRKARIVDNKTNLQVARGKGSYFWGNARFEFEDGEVYKIKRNKNANGYEIIGPYGTIFKVENHAISPVSPFNEKDFLAQAFYVFERIKMTQSPPSDVIFMYSTYYPVSTNK